MGIAAARAVDREFKCKCWLKLFTLRDAADPGLKAISWKSHRKNPQTSQCKNGRQFFGLSAYLQEEPVLYLRKRSLKHVKKQGATIAIFLLKFLSSREAGTLPAEPVPDASKIQGATIAFFVLCLRKRSLKHIKNRGQLPPFFIEVSIFTRSRYSACGTCP